MLTAEYYWKNEASQRDQLLMGTLFGAGLLVSLLACCIPILLILNKKGLHDAEESEADLPDESETDSPEVMTCEFSTNITEQDVKDACGTHPTLSQACCFLWFGMRALGNLGLIMYCSSRIGALDTHKDWGTGTALSGLG